MAQMTQQDEKKARIDAAWKEYRATAARLSSNRRLSWPDYLEADERAFRKYMAVEKQ